MTWLVNLWRSTVCPFQEEVKTVCQSPGAIKCTTIGTLNSINWTESAVYVRRALREKVGLVMCCSPNEENSWSTLEVLAYHPWKFIADHHSSQRSFSPSTIFINLMHFISHFISLGLSLYSSSFHSFQFYFLPSYKINIHIIIYYRYRPIYTASKW